MSGIRNIFCSFETSRVTKNVTLQTAEMQMFLVPGLQGVPSFTAGASFTNTLSEFMQYRAHGVSETIKSILHTSLPWKIC